MMQFKECLDCNEIKFIDEFYGGISYSVKSYCKPCANIRANASDRNEQGRLRRQKYRLKYRYGISQDEYNDLFQRQGGVCAICEQPETKKSSAGGVAALAVDHDHITGAVRGLLCHACNLILGNAKDDPMLLMKSIQYLQGHILLNDA